MGLSGQHPRRQLLAFVEGSLEPAEREQVERHVAVCAACQAEVADLAQMHDTLSALPAALRGLVARPAGSWSAVWARVQGTPVRRMLPQLNLYVSLAVVVFVLAAALPAGLAAQPALATAGAVQTPVVAPVTPSAGKAAVAYAGQVSTALATNQMTLGAQAIPVPTPVPGLKG